MGEGFDFSSLMNMFGGGGGVDTSNFGAGIGQPQVQGVFGGAPQAAGGNFMSGTLRTTPTMQNFESGTLPQDFQAPGSFGMGAGNAAYGQGGGMNMGGLLGMGAKQPQQQPHAGPMGVGGGGGGNMKGLFSALMRNPNLTHQAPGVPTLLGNSITG